MRILIIRGFPDKLNTDTYNVQEIGLAGALVRKGHTCDIVFYNGREKSRTEHRADGITIYWLRASNVLKNGIFHGLRPILEQYDVLQVHEYDQLQSWLLYTFYKKKPVVLYHGPYFDSFNRGYNLKCRVFDHLLLPFSARAKREMLCMTKSPMASAFLEEKGFRNVCSVGVGLSEEKFSEVPAETKDKRRGIRLLYVGKLEERRNTPFLLQLSEALLELSQDILITVIGSGEPSYVSQQMASIRRLEETCRFTYRPKASQQELAGIYRDTDILLFPSNYDIFGMVLLEAMYFGVACISTTNGGSSCLIRDRENGRVVDELTIKAWTEAVNDVISNPEAMEQMKQSARHTIEQGFLWDRLVDRFIDVYQKAACGTAGCDGQPST